MSRKIISILSAAIIAFLFVFVILILGSVGCASAKTHYVNPGESIQVTVNVADSGDTIIVRDGTYTENVDVNKCLTIRSENGSDSTIVQAATSNDYIFEVTADYVNISGFTVKGATAYPKAGIYLEADSCNISNNNCSNNYNGIFFKDSTNNNISNNNCSNNSNFGIRLWDSSNNSISNNNCSNNFCGIHLWWYSNNNIISNNNCSSNNWRGIYLSDSTNNKLTGNTMVENGIVIEGYPLSHNINEIDESNMVNGKPVYYWKDIEGGIIPDGAGQVILVNCTNICIENQNSHKSSIGIQLVFSSFITIRNNNCSNNHYGIRLWYSNNNSISNDNCSNNDDGIFLYHSNNNNISNNNCSSNDEGIYLQISNSNSISNNICSNNFQGIELWYANNNSVSNNNCSNNWRGIYLQDSNNNSISNNICSNNSHGINLWDSNNNSISNNICSSKEWYDIDLWKSNNNAIYLNDFMNKRYNVRSFQSTNIWNSTEKITYTYKGNQYTNYLGNYWSDYKESDTDNNGIGDSPYSIDSDKDNSPLMEPWENYFKPPEEKIFDTEQPENPYPSIMGTHKGEIIPSDNINVSKLYTYPCVGTGGHTESIKLYENGTLIASGTWNGYQDDYHNITIHNVSGAPYVMLYEGHKYNYTIVTGSYPQIIQEPSKEVTGGIITCTLFTDANGKTYTNWIPAIRLE